MSYHEPVVFRGCIRGCIVVTWLYINHLNYWGKYGFQLEGSNHQVQLTTHTVMAASYNWLYTTTHWSELKWYYITNYLQELFFSLATTVKGHITHMIPSDEATIQSGASRRTTRNRPGAWEDAMVVRWEPTSGESMGKFMNLCCVFRISRNILWIPMDIFMDISTDIPKLLMTSTVSSLSQYLLCISLYSIYIYIPVFEV